MLPPAFLDRVRQQLGPEYEAFLASYHRPRALGLRLNPLKPTAPDIAFHSFPLPWAAYGFWYPSEERPGLHPWHEAGLYYLQEPSAMAPAELLGVEPGLRVLDSVPLPAASPPAGGQDARAGPVGMQRVSPKACQNSLPERGAHGHFQRPGTPGRRRSGWPAVSRLVPPGVGGCPCSGRDVPEGGSRPGRLEPRAGGDVRPAAGRDSGRSGGASGPRRASGVLHLHLRPPKDEGAVAAFLARHPEFEIEVLDVPWFSPGMGQPGRGWSIPSASGLTSSVGEGHYAAVLRKGAGEAAPPPAFARPDRLPAPGRPSPGTWGFSFRQEGPGLRSKLVLGSGRAAGSHRTPGSAARPGAGPVPGESGSCRPTPWPSGSPTPAGPGAWTPGPGGRPVPGRGGASGQSLRLDSGDRRQPPWGGQGLRRSPEEPLPQGPAAEHLLASHRLVIWLAYKLA